MATTVRTAIIFASLPDGLPASAAALNESSISVGRRIGIVIVSAVVAQVAISTYAASVAGLPPADATAAIAAFRTVLVAVGTPSFAQIATTVGAADIQPYLAAYTAGLNAAFLSVGSSASSEEPSHSSRSAARSAQDEVGVSGRASVTRKPLTAHDPASASSLRAGGRPMAKLGSSATPRSHVPVGAPAIAAIERADRARAQPVEEDST